MKKEVRIHDKNFVEAISETEIRERIMELGIEISRFYAGKDPILLSVLNGAFLFTADLSRILEFDPEIYFIRVSSYGGGMSSSGNVKQITGLIENVSGKDVLIIEDIVDTGHTLDWLRKMLAEKRAASVKMATLLFKEECFHYADRPEFIGFNIPDRFVVGYGLDYNQRGRHLPSIYELKKD